MIDTTCSPSTGFQSVPRGKIWRDIFDVEWDWGCLLQYNILRSLLLSYLGALGRGSLTSDEDGHRPLSTELKPHGLLGLY